MTFQIYYTTRSGRYSHGLTRVKASSAEGAMQTEEAKRAMSLLLFPERAKARALHAEESKGRN